MKEPRIQPVSDPSELDAAARQTLEGLRRDGRILNIFGTLIHHPVLLQRWMVFASHILRQTSVPKRDREMLILRTAHRCGSDYEWAQHRMIALGIGLSEDEIRSIAGGSERPEWSEFERALLRSVDELLDEHELSDTTWQELASRYDTRQILDAIFTVGNYAMLAGVMNTLGVQLDEGIPPKEPSLRANR